MHLPYHCRRREIPYLQALNTYLNPLVHRHSSCSLLAMYQWDIETELGPQEMPDEYSDSDVLGSPGFLMTR